MFRLVKWHVGYLMPNPVTHTYVYVCVSVCKRIFLPNIIFKDLIAFRTIKYCFVLNILKFCSLLFAHSWMVSGIVND